MTDRTELEAMNEDILVLSELVGTVMFAMLMFDPIKAKEPIDRVNQAVACKTVGRAYLDRIAEGVEKLLETGPGKPYARDMRMLLRLYRGDQSE